MHVLMRRLRMLDLNAGKGYQVMKCACACSLRFNAYVLRYMYIGYRVRRVCALRGRGAGGRGGSTGSKGHQ